MPQQRGMKRAAKVLKRSRKLKLKKSEANLKMLERLLEDDHGHGHDHDHDHDHNHDHDHDHEHDKK